MTGRNDCDSARRELMRGNARVSDSTALHLESCPACERFSLSFATARGSLREHRLHVEPDAGFAARVAAALPSRDRGSDTMSWAAVRLLPAALALALVLGAWCWVGTASPASLAETAPTDDVLAWVLENGS